MKLETFFEKFDELAHAPDAVVKMRGLLIHFAVSGKLSPNDQREKPVAFSLSGPSPDEAGLPSNWRSGLLGDAFVFEYGDNLPAPKRTETGEYPVYGSNGVVGTHDAYLTKEPAIIVGRKGSAGALNIADGPSWTTDVAYFVCPPKDLDLRFTYYLFSTLRLDELGKGIKPGLSRKEAYALPIALPPLAEQKRIVAKVDELMALCDRLEAQQKERETLHAELARASLALFADAPTSANLPFLFHPSYAIPPADLRKSILTLAVQGKLVPQDPNDEPAGDLFARIESTKEKLIKERTIKRVAVEANPSADECESLPLGWLWTRLGNSFDVRDGTHDTPKYTTEGFPLITSKNIYSGSLLFGDANLISEKDHRQISERSRVDRRDILFAMIGSIGNPVIVETDREFSIKNVALFKYYTAADSEPRFLLLYLKLVAEEMKAKAAGGVQLFVSLGFLRNYLFPLPPLAEQKRIVAKVEQLMALVDALETQLVASRDKGQKLLEAVVGELTTS